MNSKEVSSLIIGISRITIAERFWPHWGPYPSQEDICEHATLVRTAPPMSVACSHW